MSARNFDFPEDTNHWLFIFSKDKVDFFSEFETNVNLVIFSGCGSAKRLDFQSEVWFMFFHSKAVAIMAIKAIMMGVNSFLDMVKMQRWGKNNGRRWEKEGVGLN